MTAALRGRARAARHRRRHPLRRPRRRHRATRSSWSTATCSPTSTWAPCGTFHQRPGAEAHHRPAPRSRTRPRFGVVPTDDDGRVDGLRREAAARRGAHQPDQRRHLRARAVGARPHPGRAAGVDRARDLPGAWSPTARSTPCQSDAYWIDAGTPDYVPAGPARPARRASRGGAEPACTRGARIADGAEVARSVIDGNACVDRDAVVVDSVVMSGACVGAGAVVATRSSGGARRSRRRRR